MGILNQLGNLVSNATGAAGGLVNRSGQSRGFPRILSYRVVQTVATSDFTVNSQSSIPATLALTASVWNDLFSYQVPAQQRITWGYGAAGFPENQGRVYFRIDGDSGQIQGVVRLALSDANKLNRIVVAELRTDALAGSQTDKTQQVPLPEFPRAAREDSYLLVEFRPDSTTTWTTTDSDSIVNLPITLYQ